MTRKPAIVEPLRREGDRGHTDGARPHARSSDGAVGHGYASAARPAAPGSRNEQSWVRLTLLILVGLAALAISGAILLG